MSAFTDSIDHYCDGYTVAPGCKGKECEHNPERSHDHLCEPHFAWSQCDSCGSTFGGDREQATMIPHDFKPGGNSEMIDASICVDCVLFWANGDEPEQWTQHPGT